MRKYIDLVEAHSDLAMVLVHLDEYINQNTPVDHYVIAAVLRRNGYVEPMWGNRFFRALSHPVTAGDGSTVADYFAKLKADLPMRLGGAESFCDNLEDALQFVGGTIHLAHYDHRKWIEHQPHHVVNSTTGVWAVYEVAAPATSVLWSTKGLRIMAHSQPELADRIEAILEEYGYQQEICLDTNHARIVDVHLYDSADHEEEYNED
jgi:hypothetical protein